VPSSQTIPRHAGSTASKVALRVAEARATMTFGDTATTAAKAPQ